MTGFINADSEARTATTLVMNKPTNTADGDLLIMFWNYINTGGPVPTQPGGWTQLQDTAYVANAYTIWYKTASGEPSTYTWTLDLSKAQWGVVLTYRGYSITADNSQNQNNSHTTPTHTNAAAGGIEISSWFNAGGVTVDGATTQRGHASTGGDDLLVADETQSGTNVIGRVLTDGAGIDQTANLNIQLTADQGTWAVLIGPEAVAPTLSRAVHKLEAVTYYVKTAAAIVPSAIAVGTPSKGSLIAGTGAGTASQLSVGADDTILMADSVQANGLKYVASATPGHVTPDAAAAVGTSDTFTRGDHEHGIVTYSSTPASTGTASAGTSGTAPSRGDHVHAVGAINRAGSDLYLAEICT
jgi:hypothetical protein